MYGESACHRGWGTVFREAIVHIHYGPYLGSADRRSAFSLEYASDETISEKSVEEDAVVRLNRIDEVRRREVIQLGGELASAKSST